jgi:hypothetical protein
MKKKQMFLLKFQYQKRIITDYIHLNEVHNIYLQYMQH